MKFSDLTQLLDVHYDAAKNMMTSTQEFYSCYQKPGQSLAEWKAELSDKLRYCGFTSSKLMNKPQDRALRDMLVMGAYNPKVRQAVLKEQDPDLETTVKIFQVVERVEKDLLHLSSSTNGHKETVAKVHQQNKYPDRSAAKNKSSPKTTTESCQSCGSTSHSRIECKYREFTCNFCKRSGHLERVCRKKKEEKNKSKQHRNAYTLKSVSSSCNSSLHSMILPIDVNDAKINFEVDTGAYHTIINRSDWKQIGSPVLRQSAVKLECYGGQPLSIQGECEMKVQFGGQEFNLSMVVVKQTGSPLLGLQWIIAMQIDLNDLIHGTNKGKHQVRKVYNQDKLQQTLNKYKSVFDNHLGLCGKVQAHIQMVPDAIPKFFKPRPIPFALVQGVKEEIERNVKVGILERVDTSKWAAPIVPIRKPNGKIRICGDFKVTINPQILVDQHPIPSIDELLTRLNNGEKFTKLDLTDAYLQVELSEESKQLVVINTPMGLFRYNRMPFGIANAPAIFQRLIDQVVAGIPNCMAYLDDILITGANEDEHFETLNKVLAKLSEFGLKCNMEKCSFFQDDVLYLGYIIDRFGKHPDPKRVDAIRKLPVPIDVNQVESFIGKINYYGKFIENFSNLCGPLNRLRQKHIAWNWNSECQHAFENLKTKLSEATMLVHFDPNLPVILATDASAYGIGAVLMHRYADGSERPIAHASKTLTPAEKNYSQIEKEGLSIIFGVKKFHQYLAGQKFELVTDHQPLLSIFHPAKGIPTTTANRIQRWSLYLMGYTYTIRYKPTRQHANADALSRLPAGDDDTFVDQESLQVNYIQAEIIEDSPVDAAKIRAAVNDDEILRTVRNYTSTKWPNSMSRKENVDLYPYFEIRKTLSVVSGCILKDAQVIIPKTLRMGVLKMLHNAHLGVVKMKQLARTKCWWPKMENNIEHLAKSCIICATTAASSKEEFKPWPEPEKVWARVHMDFLGPVWGSKWLVIIDAKSKFPFIADMANDTTAKNLCNALEQAIDWLGPPTTLVSDNGPPFTSFEMKTFYKKYGIEHITSAPFHPASNGIAERFVRSFKEALVKQQQGGRVNKHDALRIILRNYRWTPHTTTGIPPAEALFHHSIRTELSRLKPNPEQPKAQMTKYDVGQLVWVKHYQLNKRANWKSGVISESCGSMVYEVKLSDGKLCRRHQSQLRLRYEPIDRSFDLDISPQDLFDYDMPSTPVEPQQQPQQQQQEQRRYPQRQRRAPDRYSPV